MKRVSPEGALVKAVIQYVNARGGYAWRNQSGMLRGEHKGKTWVVHMGRVGLPDVMAVWPVRHGGALCGRLLAIECKRDGHKPTDAQRAAMDMLRARGALVVLAYSVEDVQRALAAESQKEQRT